MSQPIWQEQRDQPGKQRHDAGTPLINHLEQNGDDDDMSTGASESGVSGPNLLVLRPAN